MGVIVFMKCLFGATKGIRLQDFQSATVLFLKTKIRHSLGYPEDQQLLSSYRIQHESTIYLKKRLRGGEPGHPLKRGGGMGDRDGRNRSMEMLTLF